MEQGQTSESLAIVAGISQREYYYPELQHYLQKAFGEFEIAIPSEEMAFREMVKYYTVECLNSRLQEREYGRLVVQLHMTLKEPYEDAKYVGDYFGIQRVVGLFYSYDDVGDWQVRHHWKSKQELEEEIDRDMREAAKEVLELYG